MEEKQGKIAEIIYQNEQNGYTIAIMETSTEQFTAVGTLPPGVKGNTYLIRGSFKIHPKYGEQFVFQEAEPVLPTTADEIEGFLASGVIKGIRKKTAHLIVKEFGDDTLEILKSEPDRLLSVKGIGKKTLEGIKESFTTQWTFIEISMFLQKYGISQANAMRLYKRYGEDTISAISENPYWLIEDVRGFGFRKADAIAMKLKIAPDAPMRLKAGIRYTLSYYLSDGSTYVPKSILVEEAAQLLDVTRESIEEALVTMTVEGSVMPDHIMDEPVFYLKLYYDTERKTTQLIANLSSAELKSLQTDVESVIQVTEGRTGISLSDEQKTAVRSSLVDGVTVITGGPGTGKTTIIRTLLDIMDTNGFTVKLAAPTGRAAKRITETSGRPATTLHRLLDYSFGEDETLAFGKTEDDPIKADVIIVDEASMIDLLLMHALTEAITPGTRLILVGDADQLPSVGAGNVLRDIISSGFVHVSKLNMIFRQAEESKIVVNAHRINQGEYPVMNGKGSDFFFMRRNNELQMKELIVQLVTSRLTTYYTDIDKKSDIQVMTPVHKGNVGTIALNQALQEAFNPPKPGKTEHTSRGITLRVGDKVMQVKNDYQLTWKRPGDDETHSGVYNGDIGYITAIHPEDETLTVLYDGDKYATYDFTQLDELELAYAITVHKSQGSEFPVVVMPMTWFPPMLATRNLLYTAVTRGKKGVVLVGTERAINAMVENDRTRLRYSGLAWRLSQLIPLKEE